MLPAQVMHEYTALENFWKRYNKVKLQLRYDMPSVTVLSLCFRCCWIGQPSTERSTHSKRRIGD